MVRNRIIIAIAVAVSIAGAVFFLQEQLPLLTDQPGTVVEEPLLLEDVSARYVIMPGSVYYRYPKAEASQ
jgi:hypothetical protein